MSRQLAIAIVLVASTASADPDPPAAPAEPAPVEPAPAEPAPAPEVVAPAPAVVAPAVVAPPIAAITAVAPPDMSDQGIGAELGIATGGRVTPGGLRVTGHYLYQLADQDWFDGTAEFTFGSGSAQCFRDRTDAYICSHGLADGGGVLIGASVRHFLGGHDKFWPFLRGGIAIGVVRFTNDDVTGLAIPLELGGGLRVSVAPAVAITAQGSLDLGFGAFNHTLGLEPQVGLVITAGAEFRL